MKNCILPWAKNILRLALYYISFGHLIICSLHSLSSPFYPILSKIKNKKPLLPFLVPSGTLTIQKLMVKKIATLANYFCTTRAFFTHSSTYVKYLHIHGTFGTLYYIVFKIRCRVCKCQFELTK